MQHTLESHKLFPVVAWILVIGFAGFTYFITMQVQAELTTLNSNVERIDLELQTLK